jgi:quercetin dioxygenase-like cupin family protein
VLLPVLVFPGCAQRPPLATPSSSEITRTLLSREDVPGLPDWEQQTYLVEYPPGAVAPRHIHPALGVGYVLEGQCESAFEGELPTVTAKGHCFIEKSGPVHVLFRNPDLQHPLLFLMTYTIRKGEQPVRLL